MRICCWAVAAIWGVLASASPTKAAGDDPSVPPLPPARPAQAALDEPASGAHPQQRLHLPAPAVPLAALPSRANGEGAPETPTDTSRPGSFARQPVRVPGPFLQKKTVAPHSRQPDLELGSDGRTTLGLFGDANRIERTDARNGTSKPITDVGAGLTLQYKFGQ